jgi:hypothetical protein
MKPALEFTDAGCVVEFLSPPGRTFHLLEWLDDDDGDDESVAPIDPMSSETVE